jgi:GNAT superfamily N-acetyltransferase
MTIDPKYQRQGAGRALLKWGTNVADELGVDVSNTSIFTYSKILIPGEGYRRGDRLRQRALRVRRIPSPV